MIKEFKAVFDALKYGKSVANAAAWKRAQIAANNFAAFAASALIVACGFDYCFNIDQETLKNLGLGISAIMGIYNTLSTAASSEKAGLGKRPPDYDQ